MLAPDYDVMHTIFMVLCVDYSCHCYVQAFPEWREEFWDSVKFDAATLQIPWFSRAPVYYPDIHKHMTLSPNLTALTVQDGLIEENERRRLRF